MTKVDSHARVSFCRIELATADQAAAKSFYSSLFGRTFVDSPVLPSAFYTIFRPEGRDAAPALFQPIPHTAK
jgi:predicted enzyme related to lactoylglutathione lyase